MKRIYGDQYLQGKYKSDIDTFSKYIYLEMEGIADCLFVKEHPPLKDLRRLIKDVGRVSYIVGVFNGSINFGHYSDNIESLMEEGYRPTLEHYTIGPGIYGTRLDGKSNYGDLENSYVGRYKGTYMMIIEDLENGEKDGTGDKYSQEIYIPFNIGSIDWRPMQTADTIRQD